ncbi:hypothetical protein AYK20_06825 [Thermoplasmatales archaeon SG8-52-1]|nr:MAG: hypothetical protein AYK20_06825 [Thermoplasmatales archaeon SG8-52-1]
MVGFEFNENPLIADKIQLSVNTPFVLYEDKGEIDKYSYISSVFKAYLTDKFEYNVLYDKIKKQYYIGVDDDLYHSEYPFCKHTTLRMNIPFTVTTEFNFTRLIRIFAEKDPSFNMNLDKSIRVADDNYINKRIWYDWNSNTIKSLAENIPKYAFNFAQSIINEYIEDFDLKYNILTIKQIEFNKDYYVGHHKSSDVLHQLMYFIISSSGVEWINKLSGYGLSVYNTEKNESENLRFYGDLYNPTLKFPIGKGIYFKIYRKTTDDIRFEITFQKQFILNKLKKQGFVFVYPRLRKIAKEFFCKADFKKILKYAVDNSYSDHFAIIDNMYKFLDLSYPEIGSIVDSVTFGNPISDIDTINFIKRNKRLRPLFKRTYLGNGKKIYVYTPKIKKRIKKPLLERPSKELLELYKDYKKNYPSDKIFMGWDGKTLVHKE